MTSSDSLTASALIAALAASVYGCAAPTTHPVLAPTGALTASVPAALAGLQSEEPDPPPEASVEASVEQSAETDDEPGSIVSRYSFVVSGRYLHDGLFDEADDQFGLGLDVFEAFGDAPFGIEGGIHFFQEEKGQIDSPTLGSGDYEVRQVGGYLGLRATARVGIFEPYIGAGYEHNSATRIVHDGLISTRESDGAGGAYGHVGVYVNYDKHYWIGLDYRHFEGTDFDFVAASGESTYDQVSVTIGISK